MSCPSGQDVRAEPDPLLSRHIGGAVAHLLPLHRDRTNTGLDHPLRPRTVADDALAPVGQKLFAELRDEACRLRLQCRHQHLPRALTRNLGQRVDDGSGLVRRGDRGIFLHGVSLLREVLAGFDTRHDTPPSQATSPIFSNSSMQSWVSHYRNRAVIRRLVSKHPFKVCFEGGVHLLSRTRGRPFA